ncbi:type I methionyl aminopeptidase [bacterium]|nr:type I methionyl aminopeptidase [bacterium]
MIVRNQQEENILKEAAEISVSILKELGKNIKPGITPLDIDALADKLCLEHKVHPDFKKVEGYNNATCISVNDTAVHGIPNNIPFKEGDLVSIDFGIVHKKIYTDHCFTWSIGKPTEKNKKLLIAGRAAVENALPCAVTGNRTGDLGHIMEKEAYKAGFTTLSMYCGHGVGHSLHEEPEILAYGDKGTGQRLENGMVICVECQVVDDDDDVKIASNGWDAKTIHGGNSVMYEYMVLVRDKAPVILTDTLDWDFVI